MHPLRGRVRREEVMNMLSSLIQTVSGLLNSVVSVLF
jgi:hypothetical protein